MLSHREDLNVTSKFANIIGGYQSLHEHSYLLLVDISRDNKTRQDEMEIDGGNLDDDSIEREWFLLTVITSIQISETQFKHMFTECIGTMLRDFYESYKDVREHFIQKKNVEFEADVAQRVGKVNELSKLVFENAVVRSGKTDQASKEEVLELKDKIISMLLQVPTRALSSMVRSWHCFRLEKSQNWTSINDKFVVDSSIMTENIHPQTNTQNGRITKNLDKLEIYISNVQLYLDGECFSDDKHQIEIVLNYELELTLRMGKALLIDTQVESKRLIRNLEEQVIYKLPQLDKCILSEQHRQGLDLNNGKIIVRNMSTD